MGALKGIFDGDPFLEAVLREEFVAQMPLAEITSAIG